MVLGKLALLGIAGACGALSRFGLSGVIQYACGDRFVWGTFAVNTLGCFLFGLIWAMGESRMLISTETRFIILTGFMGSFTTFSTFAFDTTRYLQDSQWTLAAANVVGQNLLGVVFMFLGFAAARWL